MPIPEKFGAIIHRLIKATGTDALAWTEGPSGSVYSASLSTASMRIARIAGVTPGAQQADLPLQFSAVDSEGKLIDQFQLDSTDKDFQLLATLYGAAQGSSKNIETQVGGIVKELDDLIAKNAPKQLSSSATGKWPRFSRPPQMISEAGREAFPKPQDEADVTPR